MFGREPAAGYGVLAAIAALIVFYGLMSQEEVQLWQGVVIAVLPLAQAFLTRREVMPVATIKDAGMQPDAIQTRADDPNVQAVE